MFDQAEFEQKVYALVTQEVNKAFLGFVDKGRSHRDGVEIQKQVMQVLHAVTEETVIQTSYGLLLHKPSIETFQYESHLFEKITWDDVSAIFVCKNCKKGFMHHYGKNGNDFHKSASKIGESLCS